MSDLKPNSYKYREEQKAVGERKKLDKVVKGAVKTKKKSDISKVADIFISEDIQNVKSYVVWDVLVPAVKKAISDIVVNGIDMILYGETRDRRSKSNADYVSYKRYSDRDRRDDHRSYEESRSRSRYSYENIYLESRREAEEVLSKMDEIIGMYGVVSIADLYDLLGKTPNYTDNKYGWTNIRNAEPISTRDGWLLKLPKALPFD